MRNIKLRFPDSGPWDYQDFYGDYEDPCGLCKDPYESYQREIDSLREKVEKLQKLCDEQDSKLIDCEWGLLQMDLEDSKKEVQALQKQLQEKDEIINDLHKQLQKQTQKKRVGRPSKYEEYYTLIHELYKKYKRVTMVANELSKMGIEISLRQVNNIVHMKLGNNCK